MLSYCLTATLCIASILLAEIAHRAQLCSGIWSTAAIFHCFCKAGPAGVSSDKIQAIKLDVIMESSQGRALPRALQLCKAKRHGVLSYTISNDIKRLKLKLGPCQKAARWLHVGRASCAGCLTSHLSLQLLEHTLQPLPSTSAYIPIQLQAPLISIFINAIHHSSWVGAHILTHVLIFKNASVSGTPPGCPCLM